MWCTTKNLGPIGSAVLTFIGYKDTNKQTDKQTDRQAKFIYRFEDLTKKKSKIIVAENHKCKTKVSSVVDTLVG